jgi:tetratricopeptide (TPR) repeat protein
MKSRFVFAFLLFGALAWAQQPSAPSTPQPAQAPAALPGPTPGQHTPAEHAPAGPVDHADSYFHYSLGHMYEEQAGLTGRADYINQAIDEYKLAMAADPSSSFLDTSLAELYAKTGRIRDAVLEAQDILKRDPNSIEAHKLLGRIYLRSLGDLQGGAQSQNVLKLAIEQFKEIVRLDPQDVENHLLLGRLYRLDDQMDKAEAEFRTAVKMKPDSEDAVSSLAYLLNEESDPTSAVQILLSVPEDQRTAKIYSALGFTYEQQKNYKAAVDAYEKAVDLDRDNLDSLRGLAKNLLNENQYDAALQQYKVVADADPQDAETQLRIAEIYRHQGKFQEALATLQRLQPQVPDSLEVPYNIGLADEALGRYDDAIKTYTDLLAKTARDDNTYTPADSNNRAIFLERLGSVYRDTGKYSEAVDTYRKILALNAGDNSSRAYQQIIDTYRDQKQWQKALDTAREAVQKLPADRQMKLVLAAQLADLGQGDEAVKQASALISNKPDADRDVYLALAQIASRLKRWKEAEDAIAKADALATKRDDKIYVEFVWGSILERQKKYEKSEEMFKKVLAMDPNNAMTLNYLGYMMADRGERLPDALAYIQQAVQLDPQNGAYLDSLGWAYFKQGNYGKAEEYLLKAVARIGDDATIQEHLGDLYQKTGRLRLAAMHWEKALEEWNQSVPADQDREAMAKVSKKLETARERLARQPQQAERKSE